MQKNDDFSDIFRLGRRRRRRRRHKQVRKHVRMHKDDDDNCGMHKDDEGKNIKFPQFSTDLAEIFRKGV